MLRTSSALLLLVSSPRDGLAGHGDRILIPVGLDRFALGEGRARRLANHLLAS